MEYQEGVNDKINDADNFKPLFTALKIISKQIENEGFITCPKCGGKLKYARAVINGHVWGKCQTQNCLSWMQ